MRFVWAALALAACGVRPLPVDDESPPRQRRDESDDQVQPPARSDLEVCFASGEGTPAAIRAVSWQFKVRSCEASACWDFYALDAACQLQFQSNNQSRTAPVNPADCHALRNAVSTPAFLAAIASDDCIANSTIQTDQMLAIDSPTPIQTKLANCAVPATSAARACLVAVRLRVLP